MKARIEKPLVSNPVLTKVLSSMKWEDRVSFSALNLHLGLFDDIGLHSMDYSTLIRRTLEEGFSFLSKTLPGLGKALDRGLADGQFNCPTSFSKRRGTQLPKFLGSLFAEVFQRDGRIRDDPSPIAVQQLRQVLFFQYKAEFPYSERQAASVVERFLQNEDDLHTLVIKPDPLLQVASRLIAEVFKHFDVKQIVGKPGPGVTANVRSDEKYEHRLEVLPVVSKYGDKFFFNIDDAMSRLNRYPIYKHSDYFDQQRSTAKVILVNKDSRGPRLISCEKSENMWVQQGLKDFMMKTLESHPITGGQVNFSNQGINRDLARVGSVSKEYATLDLKDASDRVHYDLVKMLFQGTDLIDHFENTRSSHTELPNGDLVHLAKFAPMGSALCFPVMATCIYFILYVAFLGLGREPQGRDRIYVYGDDLIVPADMAEYTMEVLERYGLLINRDKSFVESPFLESCGMDAFIGNEVTPKRMRVCYDFSKKNQVPGDLVAMTETANQLQTLGYTSTSSVLFSFVESSLGSLPYGYPHSPFLNRNIPAREDALWKSLGRVKSRMSKDSGESRLRLRVPTILVRRYDNEETFFGHLHRTHRSWGTSTASEALGSFVKRRDIKIKYQAIDEAAFSPLPDPILPESKSSHRFRQTVYQSVRLRQSVGPSNRGVY